MTICAIDPGQKGGIAWADGPSSSQSNCYCASMPETRRELISLLKNIGPSVAYIERPNAYIPGGGYSQGFAFGKQCERPGCILETLGIRTIEVGPQTWQRALNLGKSDRVKDAKDATPESRKATRAHNAKAKRDWKNKLKSEAERRFPHLDVTLDNCDALLLLEYAVNQERQ